MDIRIDNKYQTNSTSSLEEEGVFEHVNGPFVKSEAEKRLVRKLNMRLLPLSMVIVFLQFVDKSALSVAAVLGILKDAHLSLTQYSWLSAIFFLGYFASQLPNNILLQRFPIGKYLGVLLVCWGAVTIGTGFCNSFTELAILRCLLGVFESGTYPALILIFSTLYRKSEATAGIGFLYLSNGVATIVGPASSAGIAKIGTRGDIHAWQWGYLIWGSITVFTGFVCFFLLVDGPDSWILNLTEEEKAIMVERTKDNGVVRKHAVNYQQYVEALKEPRLYLMFVAVVCHFLQNGGMVNYSTILVSTFGFSSFQSILLQIPSGVLTITFIVIAVYIQRRTRQLFYSAMFCYAISALGCLLLAVLPQSKIKLLGIYVSWGHIGGNVLILAMISMTVTGYSKKIFYNSINMLASTIGNFCGPLMLVEHNKPAYKPTMWSWFGANVLVIFCLLTIRFILARANKKREADRSPEPTDVYLNLTDKQDKNFVYHL